MVLCLPLLRADCSLAENYTVNTEEALSCSLSIFVGEHDSAVSIADATAW